MKFFTLFFIIIFCFYSKTFAQTTAIPDTNFEQKLITLGIDTNGANGNILNSDAQAVTTLTITGNTVTDFTGLEAFINVVSLDLVDNQFETLQLNTLTALETLKFGKNDLLTSLNLSQNIQLKSIDIESNRFSTVNIPSINTLDLSNNTNLEDIRIREFNNLSNLIFPITTTLTKIQILKIADTTLNFSLISNLEDLTIADSFVSTTITLPNIFINLKKLIISKITIPTIDISDYINLEQTNFSNTNVETIDFPNSTTLTIVSITQHNLQGIASFASLPNLSILKINYNDNTPLTIDVSQNLVLTDIDLSYNDMTTLDLTQNIILKKIDLSSNNFSTIDLTQNIIATNINVSNNVLPTIDLTQNVLLNNLNVSFNLFPFLNVAQNTLLEYFYANNNLLPDLDVTNNINLRQLVISHNLFTTTGLDLTQNVELNYIDISYNQIESLYILETIQLVSFVAHHNLFSGTAILDQLYTVKSNYFGVSASNLIDVSFNNLSGPMPNFASLVGTNANYFRFYFHNNAFEFGHFESQHNQFVNFLSQTNTFGGSQLPIMTQYWYAPQAKVNTIDTINATAGQNITLTTIVSGNQNHYTWFKDGVPIPGAPDSPNYVINNVNSCDEGVYYSEIVSDLVPFQNASPPGTQGKNLKLVRNDITLNVAYTSSCVTLNSPINGATNIPINAGLSWNGNPGACGYFISIGTTPNGTDLANNIDVGDVTNYNLGINFPPNTQIFVTITPYFQTGLALVCTSESFTTNATTVLPDCTSLLSPSNGASGISVNSNITWNPSINATSYVLSIGTTSGGTDIVNLLDVGNSTTYNPLIDFPQGTEIFVTITPYNSLGSVSCVEESFTTQTIVVIPSCTTMTLPANNATNVAVNSNISWTASPTTTGYFISIGTTAGGTQFLNNFDNGNATTYNPPTDFAQTTQYFVTITPYNSAGNATACTSQSFTTQTIVVIPSCTTMTLPANNATNILVNSNISWTASPTATGYFISIGTTAGGTQFLNNFDNGNATTYNPPTDFAQTTQYFVTITPYNSAGNATACSSQSFTTQTIVVIPSCTTMTLPANNATNVAINSNISWTVSPTATGYFISIGTTAGGTQFLNNFDNGNATTYNPPTDFAQTTQYFVTITPYNSAGNATACSSQSFTTQTIVVIPSCTTMILPANNATNVLVNSNISWTASPTATGYFISIGTIAGGTQFLNNFDNGNATTYNPPTDFAQTAQYFVTITPYNSAGNATACTSQSFTTQTIVVIPSCTTMTLPANNATNVAINSNISWTASPTATGYFISIGTTAGGTQFLNNFDNGNATTYNPPTDFAQTTQYFVTITPYNSAGNATACTSQSFTTQTIVVIPSCTNLDFPINGSSNVAINSNFSWTAVPNATGYFISYGTNNAANNIENMINVGNLLTYNPPANFPNQTEIFVVIIPYNSAGNAMGCNLQYFETETISIIPNCTTLFAPANNSSDVIINSSILWNTSPTATGYFISIGSTSGGTQFLNNFDNGNATTYNPPNDFAQTTQYFVTITPYNSAGNALGCSSFTFTTETVVPVITGMIIPNYFTPNNDGFNDVWKIDDPKDEVTSISIFDRYGKLLYIDSNNSFGWDGTYGNQTMPSDDYWYKIETKTNELIKGHFSLKR